MKTSYVLIIGLVTGFVVASLLWLSVFGVFLIVMIPAQDKANKLHFQEGFNQGRAKKLTDRTNFKNRFIDKQHDTIVRSLGKPERIEQMAFGYNLVYHNQIVHEHEQILFMRSEWFLPDDGFWWIEPKCTDVYSAGKWID